MLKVEPGIQPGFWLTRGCEAIFAKLVCCFLFLAAMLMLQGSVHAESDVVDNIQVNIISGNENQAPPEKIAKRIAASVSTIAEHVLIGRKVNDIAVNRTAYEKLIKEIFDRVLVGYSIEKVTVYPDKTAKITVDLQPWGDIVSDVSLQVDYGGVSPDIQELMKNDIGGIEKKVSDVLLGLPVDAVDWAGSVTRSLIREAIAGQLPEYYVNFDVIAGTRTIVKIALVPTGAIVQDVRVSFRSSTIPNLFLGQVRPVIEEEAKALSGLPIAFLERHRSFFVNKLATAAAAHPLTRRYGLTLAPQIRVGSDTEVLVNAETNEYRIFLEGYLDMGREKDSTSARFHVGKFLNKRTETFLEINFIPATVAWDFMPGFGYQFMAATTAGMKYNVSDRQSIVWLNQYLNRNWMLRLERNPVSGRSELGVRYKIHDLLSVEYVFTNREKWLRLVGSL